MPRKATPLTAARVRTAKAGSYTDGDGLILLVRTGAPTLSRFWVLRYSFNGTRREAGLGRAGEGLGSVSLAEARRKVADWRAQLRAGIDPLAERDALEARHKAAAQAEAALAITFAACADFYIQAHEAGWRNAKHRTQWRNTLRDYAFPVMGELPVAGVETAQVMQALEPIWRAKPETAARLRGRIESVLDYATARGWRSGENPARWKGHIANMLPRRGKVAAVEHHAALPWREVGTFWRALAGQGGTAALALRFTILTAARTGEVTGARWSEIDLDEAVWTVPAARMKAGREHRVPLAPAALAILREVAPFRCLHPSANSANSANSPPDDAPVFPGAVPGRGLSNMAMSAVLRRMGRGDLTVHGFRSCFRDWAAEATAFDRETAEAALAHTLRDKVEAAYRRGDLFEKRRRLMDSWATNCLTVRGESTVTPLRGRGA